MTDPPLARTSPSSTAPPAAARRPQASGGWPTSVRVIESVQTLLTALMLAFVFRAFFVEAFVIPTGSMAETLLGQHGTLVCPHCGWEFDYGPVAGATRRAATFRPPAIVDCPNCHRSIELTAEQTTAKAGDRILVHKWPYSIGGRLKPRRWDVIVFRDPRDPSQNYIKRLVALPNETIEIVDGDVFIQAVAADELRIARKTPAAQSMLWFVVFDQDHVLTDAPAWVGASAAGPPGRGWSGLATRVLRYDARDGTPRTIAFDPAHSAHYLKDVCGYNHGRAENYVGDARLVAEVTVGAGDGWLRWELARDDRLFAARLHADGRVALLTQGSQRQEVVLDTTRVGALADGRPRRIELAHLDYRVYLKVDGRECLATTDEQYAPNLGELRTSQRVAPVRLRMTAADLSLTVRSLRVERDVYYTYDRRNTQRAYAGCPFRLGADEYFVLGDNSPNSADSREWYRVGAHLQHALEEEAYQIGTVRADQIVGRAFLVYLPGLLPLSQGSGWRIPDLGRVRLIR